MAHQVACLDCKLALTDVETCEIRDKFSFQSFENHDQSDADQSQLAHNAVVTSATSGIQLDELDFLIRGILGQISSTLEWSQSPVDVKEESEKHYSARHDGCLFRGLDSVSCDVDEKTVNS